MMARFFRLVFIFTYFISFSAKDVFAQELSTPLKDQEDTLFLDSLNLAPNAKSENESQDLLSNSKDKDKKEDKKPQPYKNFAEQDAEWLAQGGDPTKAHYSDLMEPGSVSRLKDIATIQGVRDNQLVGYGLVIGLNGTGDSLKKSPFTEQSMRAMLDNLGISPPAGASRSNNMAAVIVTATMPPFATAGSKIDVNISSLGDASSLQGGTLIMTPLLGADGKTYAVAQGNLVTSGFVAQGDAAKMTNGVPTSSRIPNGALVERKIPGNFNGSNQMILELRDPDFSTVTQIVDIINIFSQKRYNEKVAKERDSKTIILTRPEKMTNTRFISEIEKLPVPVDGVARVVVDEKTGTVVIGDKVRVSRVAISHGSLTVKVVETPSVSQPDPFSEGETTVVPQTDIDAKESTSQLGILGGTNLDNLVKGLNQVGIKPTGIIAILQALKSAGALHGALIVQ